MLTFGRIAVRDRGRDSPAWAGPIPVAASTHATAPFGSRDTSGLSQAMHNLSVNASPSMPQQTSQIGVLNANSFADDGPLIVSSSSTSGNSLGAVGEGPRSPPTASFKVFFTTDTGPDVPFQGSHYLKVFQIAREEYEKVFAILNQQVSAMFVECYRDVC